jgi:hypothetical protein
VGFALLGLVLIGFLADRFLRKRFRHPKMDVEAELDDRPDEDEPVEAAGADV